MCFLPLPLLMEFLNVSEKPPLRSDYVTKKQNRNGPINSNSRTERKSHREKYHINLLRKLIFQHKIYVLCCTLNRL